MSKINELSNFLGELQGALNSINVVDLSAIDYYLDNISKIKIKDDADAETKAEIESYKSKLLAVTDRIKTLASRYNGTAEALMVAISNARKLGTNIVAYSKVDKNVFADNALDWYDGNHWTASNEEYSPLYDNWERIVNVDYALKQLKSNGKLDEALKEAWDYDVEDYIKARGGYELYYDMEKSVKDAVWDLIYSNTTDYLDVSAEYNAKDGNVWDTLLDEIKDSREEIVDDIVKDSNFKGELSQAIKDYIAKREKENSAVYADAFPERNDKIEDYEAEYDIDYDKTIRDFLATDAVKKDIEMVWNADYAKENLGDLNKSQVANEILPQLIGSKDLSDDILDALRNFVKYESNLVITHGKYSQTEDDDVISQVIDDIIQDADFRRGIEKELDKFLADKGL